MLEYPKMLYRFVGEEDEEWSIVANESEEVKHRKKGFHHHSEPNPPRKGRAKAQEVLNESEETESVGPAPEAEGSSPDQGEVGKGDSAEEGSDDQGSDQGRK